MHLKNPLTMYLQSGLKQESNKKSTRSITVLSKYCKDSLPVRKESKKDKLTAINAIFNKKLSGSTLEAHTVHLKQMFDDYIRHYRTLHQQLEEADHQIHSLILRMQEMFKETYSLFTDQLVKQNQIHRSNILELVDSYANYSPPSIHLQPLQHIHQKSVFATAILNSLALRGIDVEDAVKQTHVYRESVTPVPPRRPPS